MAGGLGTRRRGGEPLERQSDPAKVAIYIRWSTEDQGQGTTPAVQAEGCRHFVLSQGWQVRGDLTFVDDGYSGGTMERPGLTALRRAVEAGLVECVVVFKLDRLSRSVVDMVKLVIEEWGDRCSVKSAREPIDTTTHAGKMFFYTLTNFAEWERSVIRERTFSGKTKRAQAGRNPGFRPPYGYRPGPEHTFAVDEAEAAVVRRLFEQYAAGVGIRALAAELNRTGITFRGGRRWHPQTVHRVLTSPIYAGDLVWGVRRYNPHHGRRPGEVWWPRNDRPLVALRDAVPAVVERAVWERAQAARAARPSPRRGESGRRHAAPALLTGLLRCGACGGALVARGRRYYCCAARLNHGGAACGAPYVPAPALDSAVAARTAELFGERAAALWQAGHAAAAARRESERRAALAAAEARLRQLEAQAERLGAEYREGLLTLPEFRELRQGLREEDERLRADVRRLGQAAPPQAPSPAAAPWQCLALPEQRAVLQRLVAAATARLEGDALLCEITWRLHVQDEVSKIQPSV